MKNYRIPMAAVVLLALCGCTPQEEDKPAPEDGATETAPQETAPREEKNAMEAAPAEELIWIFRARGNRQCENGGTSLEESRSALSAAGVEIQESRCGTRTDRMYASVCGGQTGDILLHLVEKKALDAALQQGFDPAATIEYQQASCPGNGS